MVEKIFKLLGREFGDLHSAALLLGLSSFASQLLALIRDRLLAAQFGASSELDIYYAAFRIPDLVYVSLASFISVSVLIPFIIGGLKEKKAEVRRFLDSALTLFCLLLVVVSAILFVLMPYLSRWLAPGFDEQAIRQLITLSRWLLLSPFLLGLSNLVGAVTQSLRRFFIYALSPLLYNVGIIVGVIFLSPRFGLIGLVWGVVLGALLHLLIQVPTVVRAKLMPRLSAEIAWTQLKPVILLSIPRTLTLSAHQLSILVLVALASLFGAGAIAVFNFAFNLQSVPLSIIGVSYSVAAFPTLVALFSGGEHDKFIKQLTMALRHILFWSVPAVVMFIVLRAQIVRVILGSGQFDWRDTRLTAAALALFIISVAAQSMILLFVRGYYAAGKTRRPLWLNVTSSILIIVIAAVLSALVRVRPELLENFADLLRVGDLTETAVLVLPLAFSLGVLINLGLFWHYFQKDFGRFPRLVDRALHDSIIGSLAAGLVTYILLTWLGRIFDLNTFVGIFGQGFIAGIIGLAVFALVLHWRRNEELSELIRSIRGKFWRTKPVAPEPEGL